MKSPQQSVPRSDESSYITGIDLRRWRHGRRSDPVAVPGRLSSPAVMEPHFICGQRLGRRWISRWMSPRAPRSSNAQP